jgi:purine-nucleoside phosphorylase
MQPVHPSHDNPRSLAGGIAAMLRERGVRTVDALIILGSGMSGCYLPDEYDIVSDAPRSDLPGHTGRLAILRTSNTTTLVSLGRRHVYEGYLSVGVAAIVEVAARFGARTLIATNAAGGLNPRYEAGDIMLIESCLGMMLGRRGSLGIGSRPIDAALAGRGAIDVARERALQSLTHPEAFARGAYDAIEEDGLRRGLPLRRGVYAGVLGPSYETRAEIRMLRRMGADAVGMSTVFEVAAARALGMRAIGLSLITNVLTDTDRVGLDHSHVVEQGRLGETRMRGALDAALGCI